MSRIARLRRGGSGDEGFTLLEVIVSLGLFAIFSAAITPVLISSTKATLVTKLDTGGKNLSQERFEVMRNLPYHLDVQVDTTPDLLDTYYPNLTAAAGVNSAGYVSTGPRRAGEPATGVFYRTVFSPVPGFDKYTQYVATQFLDLNRSPVTPPAGYNSQTVAMDQPPSLLVGVTVTTVWTVGTMSKSFNVFSEIADGRPQAPRVALESRVAALRILGVLDGQDLLYEGGVVNLDGTLTTGSSAGASARGAFASLGDLLVDGAKRAVSAPPTAVIGGMSQPNQQLVYNSVPVAQLARSSVDKIGASTPSGEPTSGSSSVPALAETMGSADTRFTNLPDPADPGLLILTDEPVVSIVENGVDVHARAGGWMRSTGGATHGVTTNGTAETGVVRILPTKFAPDGLIQVRLEGASIDCTTNGSSGSTVPEYKASLRYWRANPAASDGTGSYVDVSTLHSSNSSDPLDSELNLTVGPGGTVVYDDGVRPLYLGEYFKTVASQTTSSLAAGMSAENGVKRLKASYAGMVSLSTVPLRKTEDLSNVSVQLGAMSCLVEDNR